MTIDIDCNGCIHLDPQEKDQTPAKEPHMCRYWNLILHHDGMHPCIPHKCVFYSREDKK